MSLRAIVGVLVAAIAALAIYAWSRNTQRAETAPPAAVQEQGGAPQGAAPQLQVESGGDPGIEWKVPSRWGKEAGSPMRLATYQIPAASGDPGAGNCAVYYFGPGQGGGTDANIERWIGEFENPEKPQRSSRTVDGIPISTVRVRGTYRAHAGMGDASENGQRLELYGAIVEGPGGSVFFKLTGPIKTIDAAAGDFESLLGSIRKK